MCQLRLSSLFQFALAPKIHTKCKIIESCNSIEILISYVLYSNLYPTSVLPNLYMLTSFSYDIQICLWYIVCDRFQELFGFWFTWFNSHLQKEAEKNLGPQLSWEELSWAVCPSYTWATATCMTPCMKMRSNSIARISA